MGQDDAVSPEDIMKANTEAQSTQDLWCCMYRVLSLQEDFLSERPLIQIVIENTGHVCLFLLQFHCELNPIEMLWGYAKYCALTPYYSCTRCILNALVIQDIAAQ
jgi:hypothetical protein